MRAARAPLGAVLLSLLLALTLTQTVASGATRSGSHHAGSTHTTKALKPRKPPRPLWVPTAGVTFNDPTSRRHRRVIMRKVIRSINSMRKGSFAQLVSWNLDDRPAVRALLAANKRGVHVQVVVSGAVDNPNWTRLRKGLNRVKTDKSFARKCTGGCRSNVKIMHTKMYLFSRVHTVRYISMFGSSNLTTPAGNRQWNDMVTTYNKRLYYYLLHVFQQFAADRRVKGGPYDVHSEPPYRVTLFPVGHRNPVVNELKRIRCHGVTGGAGNGHGRTKIRIAIAGWFDAYGGKIAQHLRKLWDNGCDIKIVTTEAGGGVRRIMRARYGRGPVPMRDLSPDRNGDGIPEKYLHMKALAVSGVYNDDTSANVVFTGSPNWSTRASRSEEIWVRILDRARLTRRYLTHVDRLFGSNQSSGLDTSAQLEHWFGAGGNSAGLDTMPPPKWLELD